MGKKKKKILFVENKILDFIERKKFQNREILVTETKKHIGLEIVIFNQKDGNDYTYNFKDVNNNEHLNKYLEKNVYPRLNLVRDIFKFNFYVYANITKDKEFIIYDMYVNDTFLDFDFLKEICNKVGLKTPNVIFSGMYKNYTGKKPNVTIRYDLEMGNEETRIFKAIKE